MEGKTYNFKAQIIPCKDCGFDFTVTESEQEFYFAKGLSIPARCPACRERRKQLKQSGGTNGQY